MAWQTSAFPRPRGRGRPRPPRQGPGRRAELLRPHGGGSWRGAVAIHRDGFGAVMLFMSYVMQSTQS
eukprot:11172078-Lingulodinium_polyedra.AAC.1